MKSEEYGDDSKAECSRDAALLETIQKTGYDENRAIVYLVTRLSAMFLARE